MTPSADAVVIGAGVIGSAVALELARSGRSVICVDKGPAPGAGSTSAWISTRSGRVPSSVASTHEPGTARGCCERKSADGFATPRRPFSVIAKTPSSFTAPKRFFAARTSRNAECGSPSK